MNNHIGISVRSRAQLLDDAFNLALANQISYSSAFELASYLQHERDYVPWRAVLTELDYIDIMLRRTSDFQTWKV